jgi:mannose-6-phosphate isomerase class I
MMKIVLITAFTLCFSLANGQNKQNAIDNDQTKSVKMKNIPFQAIDWTSIEKVKHKGETGDAYWQTMQFPGLRVRIVEYTNSYLADHWCEKGHIVYCLEGEFVSELSTGEKITLKKGESYVVSDKLSSHRSKSEKGVKLLIIDGDFLKHQPD